MSREVRLLLIEKDEICIFAEQLNDQHVDEDERDREFMNFEAAQGSILIGYRASFMLEEWVESIKPFVSDCMRMDLEEGISKVNPMGKGIRQSVECVQTLLTLIESPGEFLPFDDVISWSRQLEHIMLPYCIEWLKEIHISVGAEKTMEWEWVLRRLTHIHGTVTKAALQQKSMLIYI